MTATWIPVNTADRRQFWGVGGAPPRIWSEGRGVVGSPWNSIISYNV